MRQVLFKILTWQKNLKHICVQHFVNFLLVGIYDKQNWPGVFDRVVCVFGLYLVDSRKVYHEIINSHSHRYKKASSWHALN